MDRRCRNPPTTHPQRTQVLHGFDATERLGIHGRRHFTRSLAHVEVDDAARHHDGWGAGAFGGRLAPQRSPLTGAWHLDVRTAGNVQKRTHCRMYGRCRQRTDRRRGFDSAPCGAEEANGEETSMGSGAWMARGGRAWSLRQQQQGGLQQRLHQGLHDVRPRPQRWPRERHPGWPVRFALQRPHGELETRRHRLRDGCAVQRCRPLHPHSVRGARWDSILRLRFFRFRVA